MIRFIIISVWALSCNSALAQVKIGDDLSTIHPSSLLELESADQALILTRISDAQMQAITPMNGAIIYNTDTRCVHFYNGGSWQNLCENEAQDNILFSDNMDGTFTFTGGSGGTLTFYGAPETITTLLENSDGTYTFINESGTATLIDFNATDSQTLSTDNTPGNLTISNGNAISLNVDDADADIVNEIQELQYNAGIISLSLDPMATSIDLSGFDSNMLDDFSGSYTDLTNVPADLADGDDDTTYSAGAGITLTGTVFAADNTALAPEWANISNKPVNLDVDSTDDFSGDFTDLTNVPVNLDTDSTDDFSGSYTDLTNVPADLADGDDDTTYSAGVGISLTGTVFAADNSTLAPEWANISNKPLNLDTDSTDDFSGSYTDLTGVPLNMDTDSTDDFSGDFADLINVPVNLDTDSTDDFSGSYTDLTNVPADLADGDDDTTYSAGTGITLTGTVFGADNSTLAPEWANISNKPLNLDTDSTDDFSGDFADLINVPVNLDTDSTDDFSGSYADLTGVPLNMDTDSTDDFSGSYTDLTNVPADLADGDDDTTYSAGTGITLTGTVFGADNSTLAPEWANISNKPLNLDTDSTDDFSGSYTDLTNVPLNMDIDSTDDFSGSYTDLTNVPLNMDIDSTDDFSGSYTDLTNVPADLADGDDDTTYSAGAGITLTGTVFAADNTALAPEWANISNKPVNLDVDSTDDFSGSYTDLTGVPLNMDTDSTDDFSGDFADLINVPVNLDTDSTDDFSGSYTDLTGVPLNMDTDSTDDFSGSYTDLTNVPADLADGDDDTTYSAGAGITLTGTVFAADNTALAPEWANISNKPVNLDVDSTDDFSGDFTDLTNVPVNLDTDSTDDFSGSYTDLTNVPADLADGDDDTTYSAGVGISLTGTVFAADNSTLAPEWANISNKPLNLDTDSTDDFSGSYTDLTGVPLNMDTDSTDDFSGDFADLINVPVNLDTDSTDDFSGSYTDLTNVPADLADGDDDTTYSAGTGITLTGTVFGADNSTLAPEWANISNKPLNLDTDSTDDFSGDFADLINVPVNLDTDSTDDFSGSYADLTGVPLNMDTDSTDDFSGSYTDLTNVPADLADGDDDTTYSAGTGITLTGTVFGADNSTLAPEWANISNKPLNLDTDSTDDFSGSYTDLTNVPLNMDIDSTDDFSGSYTDLTNVPLNMDIDSTDDFSGSYTDLTNVPADLADGDDDTTYSAGAGITLTGTVFAADNTALAPEWANISNKPVNLDVDSTDDFSGSYTDLTGVPLNMDTDSTDDFSGDFADLINVPVNLDTDSTDDFSGSYTDLTGVPLNMDTDSTDDFSGSYTDLTNVPADLADGDDDTTYSAGAGITLTGTVFAADNTALAPEWANISNKPVNLDVDSTDDFSGDFTDLTNVPVNLDTDSTDDFSGSYTDLTNVPADLADGDDDTTYSAGVGISLTGTVFAADNSTLAPEWANISNKPLNLDTDSTDDFSGSYTDLTGVPLNMDTDSTDDFSGDFADLINVPVNLDTDSTDDFSGDFADLINVPVNLDTDSTDDFSGSYADLTGVPLNMDTDSTDDFSGSYTDLTNVPADLADGDDDTTYSAGTGITLTGTVFGADNSTLAPEWANISNKPLNLDTDSTDDFSGSYTDLTNVPLNMDIDSTDDFSGSYTDLTNVPADLADGDDDTTYSAGAGITLTGTVFAADNTALAPEWANISNKPVNLDVDSTDDFSGSYTDLTGVPADLADGDDDNQTALEVSYSNATSGLTATDTQNAIDELASSIVTDTHLGTDNIVQDPETRTYDINSQNLGFTNGQVGVGTTTPTSTLHLAGSMALPIRSSILSTTLTANDYTLIMKNDNQTVTLPAASTCPGRVYIIKNYYSDDEDNNTSPSYINNTGSFSSMLSKQRIYQLQSDGTFWHQINLD